MTPVEVRCPVGPRRLFMKLRLSGQQPRVTDGNLMEFACHDCKRRAQRSDRSVIQVLHRFDLLGSLVETEVVSVSGRSDVQVM